MRLADTPEHAAVDGTVITLTPALLRGEPLLEALFAPFRECVALQETLMREGSAQRPSRRLTAEIRADRLDDLRAVVRQACPPAAFDEIPTELDDVADGTEWRERARSLSVSLYRLFGGSTALHVTSAKSEAPDAPLKALRESPLAVLAELVDTTSSIDLLSCSRSAGETPQWHLQATLRDLRRFEQIAPRLVALGFEDRNGKHWHQRIIAQRVGKDRWMAAVPGIDFAS